MNRLQFSFFLFTSFYIGPLAAGEGIHQANEYQNNSGFQWKSVMESLERFPFNENDKVLDVGCGNGKITAFIAKQVPEGIVIGLDISPDMLLHVSSNFSTNNLLFIRGNAKSIPFKQQFDKLVSFYTLNWVIEQEQALQSFKDSLKPGGSLLLIVPGKAPSNLGVNIEKMVYSEKWASSFPNYKQERIYFTAEEYLVLLEKVQLEIQSLETYETTTKYKNKEALLAHARPLFTFIDHLPPALQEEFIDDIITKQIQENHTIFPDGSIGAQTLKIEVIASNPI